jgi:uncharacterized protein (DUF2235 family)
MDTNKNIIICSDGTGNTTIKGRGTNVFKLFEAIDVNGHRSDSRLRRQLAFYDDGVGTENLRSVRILAGATGYGLSRNVKQLYRELCRVYEPGDAIYLFGFSRGAFTVRTLSGLINDCGIVDPADCHMEDEFRDRVRLAYKAYRRKYRALLTRVLTVREGVSAAQFRQRYASKDAAGNPVVPTIRLLGVWDTVDAVGLPFSLADVWNRVIWQYKFETTTLCGVVEKGCHALALDDGRAEFEPVIWNEDEAYTRDRVEQVWFAGAHSNVGGGYPQHGMSLVSLDWMMSHAESCGVRFVAHTREEYATQHSFADKLYDPRSGLGMFYRWKPRNVLALSRKRGIHVPKVHVSVVERIVQAPEGYAPGNIPPRCEIVTTEEHSTVRVEEVAAAIARAHGPGDPSPLLARKQPWISVGLAGYAAFILAMVGGLLRAAGVMASPPGQKLEAFLQAPWEAAIHSPVGLAATIWTDSIAFWLLASGLTAGYVLSALSDRRIRRYYSGFWHNTRPMLRDALRRTPAASTLSVAPSAPVPVAAVHGRELAAL